jgi:hypothetical protein
MDVLATAWRHRFRLLALVLFVALLTPVVAQALAPHPGPADTMELRAEEDWTAPPRPNATVVTSHHGGYLAVIGANGSLSYVDTTHDGYWDVDPVPDRRATLEYVAHDDIGKAASCRPLEDHCVRQILERVNLSTGETTQLYTEVQPRSREGEWHDADRLDEHRVVAADMYLNRLRVINHTSGIGERVYPMQRYYPLSAGGPYPGDWTHLNDVEILDNGQLMGSVRNMDQVLFLWPNGTVADRLGADGDHDIMYEQHNPDYIPAENGGPAVVIADSENDRIVEYQRRNGDWQQSWRWADGPLSWPRDADRLPNGTTLVTDTIGNRLVEVGPDGDRLWTVSVPKPYEAERLGTGDESAGGASAARLSLANRSPADDAADRTQSQQLRRVVIGLLPAKVYHGIKNVSPLWFGVGDGLLLLGALLVALGWIAGEVRRYRRR